MERSLIDFNCPNNSNQNFLLNPLILLPSQPAERRSSSSSVPSLPLLEASESNPFDMVANQMASYSAAEEDPFEMAFLSALNGNQNDGDEVRKSPKVLSDTGGDILQMENSSDIGFRVKSEFFKKIDSIAEEVVSEAKGSEVSEFQGVTGRIRNGLVDRLSSLDLGDILPPGSLLESFNLSDLVDSSFGGGPNLINADDPVMYMEVFKTKQPSPSCSSPSIAKSDDKLLLNDSASHASVQLDLTHNSFLDNEQFPCGPPSAEGTPNASFSVTEPPFDSPLLHSMHSDEELKALVSQRIHKIIQMALSQSKANDASKVADRSGMWQSPCVRLEAKTGVNQYLSKQNKEEVNRNDFSTLNIPVVSDSQLVMSRGNVSVTSGLPTECESPVFNEPDLSCEANIVAKYLLGMGDDACDLLMSEQPPDSLHLPELSDDELELLEEAAKKSKQQVFPGVASTFSPPAQSKVSSSAHKRSQSAGFQSKPLPPTSPPTLPPLPLCEDAIRSLTLSSKYSPVECLGTLRNSHASSNIKSKSPSVEPVVAPTRVLLRKKIDTRSTNLPQKGPLKAILPVKSMTRGSGMYGSPHIANGSLKIGPAVQRARPVPSMKVVPNSPHHGSVGPLAASTPGSVHAPKRSLETRSARSPMKSMIPSRSPLRRGIVHPTNTSHLALPQDSLAKHNRDGLTFKPSPSRKSLLPATSHSRPVKPNQEINKKKTANLCSPKGITVNSPSRKPSSNPRVLADVNISQAGWVSPIRKTSLLPAPRVSRRTQVIEKENFLYKLL